MNDATRSRCNVTSRLIGSHLTLNYEHYIVANDLSVSIPDKKFTVIIGPNACGKSTLLKALCRVVKPQRGKILLDGKDIQKTPTKMLACQLGLLPQQTLVPENITVAELVARGRYPHQTLLQQWSQADQQAVMQAMRQTGIELLADCYVDELSGGQRQRVWIAMVLAQQTPIIFLDEPTTWLDISHQIELLDLFMQLNLENKQTVITVLHDINQACRYANHLIVMQAGKIVTQGKPQEIITSELIFNVFGVSCIIISDPVSNTPLVIPRGRYHIPMKSLSPLD